MVNICTYAMKATKQRLNCKADANETKSFVNLAIYFWKARIKIRLISWTSFMILNSCKA